MAEVIMKHYSELMRCNFYLFSKKKAAHKGAANILTKGELRTTYNASIEAGKRSQHLYRPNQL